MNYVQKIVTKNKSFLEKLDNSDSLKNLHQECNNYFKEINDFLKTGNIDFCKILNTGKENVEPIIVPTNKRKGRARKPALADITENNVQPSDTVNIKKEKISDAQNVLQNSTFNASANVEIKSEEMPAPTKLPPRKKRIKSENVEVPQIRSTRTRTRSKKQNAGEDSSDTEKNSKRSDVIIQNTTITTIEISDSDRDTELELEIEDGKIKNGTETRSTRSKMLKKQKNGVIEDQVKKSIRNEINNEESERADAKKIRTTRTKTKQKKRIRSDSFEGSTSETERKKSKSESNTEHECNGSTKTVYEDAVSVIDIIQGNNQNATYIASSRNSQESNKDAIVSPINSTIIVENPKIVGSEKSAVTQENDSENEFEHRSKTPPKPPSKAKGTKQIFSPFEKTPLKKKVEAFEKLGVEASSIPTRITRTKKKAQKDGESRDDEAKNIEEERKKSTEKSKVFTPITSKFLPKVCSTSKISKLHPAYGSDMSINNESVLSVKSASALKSSQAEFREREKRRQEKEREALKKREALLQAQTEEKRRKREEKQQKAQQQRDILEKEKQKQLEVQRVKEEKHKQALAEREEKWQKQKEEAEKKRLMAKQKAHKEKEEAFKLAEQKKMAEQKSVMDKQSEIAKSVLKQKTERPQQQQQLPIYMTTKPPLLPTDDCYDSDDPEYKQKSVVIKRNTPAWNKDRDLREMQMAMIVAGEAIKNTFFCRQAHTPDLQDIFEIIDPKKLTRTSSAVWRKPPRYTLMPTIEDQFSEDSD